LFNCTEEAFHVSTRSVVTTALVLTTLGFVSPVYAQETAAAASNAGTLIQWSIVTSGFALAIAAGLGALGQGKAVAAAVEAIARNPSASTDIRANLLLGLVLIESLVIYVLLISLILLFLAPFGAPKVA
jgi:F-type H+-transporting ATPase subunit c